MRDRELSEHWISLRVWRKRSLPTVWIRLIPREACDELPPIRRDLSFGNWHQLLCTQCCLWRKRSHGIRSNAGQGGGFRGRLLRYSGRVRPRGGVDPGRSPGDTPPASGPFHQGRDDGGRETRDSASTIADPG